MLEVRDLWPQVLIDQGGKVRTAQWCVYSLDGTQLYRHASTVVVLAKGAEPFVRERGARQAAWLPNGPDLALLRLDHFGRPPCLHCAVRRSPCDANALDNVIAAAVCLSSARFRFEFGSWVMDLKSNH